MAFALGQVNPHQSKWCCCARAKLICCCSVKVLEVNLKNSSKLRAQGARTETYECSKHNFWNTCSGKWASNNVRRPHAPKTLAKKWKMPWNLAQQRGNLKHSDISRLKGFKNALSKCNSQSTITGSGCPVQWCLTFDWTLIKISWPSVGLKSWIDQSDFRHMFCIPWNHTSEPSEQDRRDQDRHCDFTKHNSLGHEEKLFFLFVLIVLIVGLCMRRWKHGYDHSLCLLATRRSATATCILIFISTVCVLVLSFAEALHGTSDLPEGIRVGHPTQPCKTPHFHLSECLSGTRLLHWWLVGWSLRLSCLSQASAGRVPGRDTERLS
jgi:hypothetical protein